jgi:hypothetical protein
MFSGSEASRIALSGAVFKPCALSGLVRRRRDLLPRRPVVIRQGGGEGGRRLDPILRNFSNLGPETPRRTGHALLRREIRSIISLASSALSTASFRDLKDRIIVACLSRGTSP